MFFFIGTLRPTLLNPPRWRTSTREQGESRPHGGSNKRVPPFFFIIIAKKGIFPHSLRLKGHTNESKSLSHLKGHLPRIAPVAAFPCWRTLSRVCRGGTASLLRDLSPPSATKFPQCSLSILRLADPSFASNGGIQ